MAKYGTLLVPSNISIDEFNGDGSTTQFTLTNGVNLASDNAYQVFVDGMLQDDWSRSGKVFTFTTAPPSGTKNIRVYTYGERLDINTPSDGAVGTAQLANSIQKQLPKVICVFQDGGTVTYSHNVTSVTDNGVGDWTVTFDTDFANINYAALVSVDESTFGTDYLQTTSKAVGSVRINNRSTTGTLTDPAAGFTISVVIWGDQ